MSPKKWMHVRYNIKLTEHSLQLTAERNIFDFPDNCKLVLLLVSFSR